MIIAVVTKIWGNEEKKEKLHINIFGYKKDAELFANRIMRELAKTGNDLRDAELFVMGKAKKGWIKQQGEKIGYVLVQKCNSKEVKAIGLEMQYGHNIWVDYPNLLLSK